MTESTAFILTSVLFQNKSPTFRNKYTTYIIKTTTKREHIKLCLPFNNYIPWYFQGAQIIAGLQKQNK